MSTTTAPELRAVCSARDISAAVLNCSFNCLSSFARAVLWLAIASCWLVAIPVSVGIAFAISGSASCGIMPPQQHHGPKTIQLQQLIHLRQHRSHALSDDLTL